ncbi:hypothetical protein PRIPAC_86114 [Pristionchus pacificus]|uniref:K Homology domain containing protein n=1 Tax=Pristionchus pacificus TaxID=54126 RepID=A0A2A6BMJ8_PRIPA|nr:hypothetical protein PRIPAC_86114 [Pristionchus pacificus]|eukprot:PDM67127.1 K Homology domain containing protein [Pristionchus pacificus]
MIFRKFPFFSFSCFIFLICEMVVTLEVPLSVLDAERLGEFIGPRGVNIKSLEQKHKVSPFLDNPINTVVYVLIRLHSVDPTRITASVIGDEFDTRLAQCDLQSSAVEIRGRQLTHKVIIPTSKLGMIIGKGGSYFRQVRDRCNVRLNVDKDEKVDEKGWINSPHLMKSSLPKREDATEPDEKSMSVLRIQGSFEGILLACNMFHDRLTTDRKSEEDRFENRSTPHFMSDWGAINDEKID